MIPFGCGHCWERSCDVVQLRGRGGGSGGGGGPKEEVERRLEGSNICKEGLPVIGGFLCVCGTLPPYLLPLALSASCSSNNPPLFHSLLPVHTAPAVSHTRLLVEGSVHINFKKLSRPPVQCSGSECACVRDLISPLLELYGVIHIYIYGVSVIY